MSKSDILHKIRSQISPDLTDNTRRAIVDRRLRAVAKGVLPDLPKAKALKIGRFVEKVLASGASIDHIGASEIGKSVALWLREHNLPPVLRTGSDERLKSFRRQGAKSLTIHSGRSFGDDLTCLSHAECGISETGTLIMLSGAENPTTLNFLPENHIIVVNESDIEVHYEAIWPRIRKIYGSGQMPRTVNMITGPSRSADIEQTLIMGAHGPVRLHIILVKN